jgi:hypothetical protein
MNLITWTREPRKSFWSGAVGAGSYAERFAFGITKVKPASAPNSAIRMRHRNWQFTFVLHQRGSDSLQYLMGAYGSFAEAKQAAEALVGNDPAAEAAR